MDQFFDILIFSLKQLQYVTLGIFPVSRAELYCVKLNFNIHVVQKKGV